MNNNNLIAIFNQQLPDLLAGAVVTLKEGTTLYIHGDNGMVSLLEKLEDCQDYINKPNSCPNCQEFLSKCLNQEYKDKGKDI